MFLVIIVFGFSILICQIICTNYEVNEFAQLIMGCLLKLNYPHVNVIKKSDDESDDVLKECLNLF